MRRHIDDRVARGSWIRCTLCGKAHGRNFDCQRARAERIEKFCLLALILIAFAMHKWWPT